MEDNPWKCVRWKWEERNNKAKLAPAHSKGEGENEQNEKREYRNNFSPLATISLLNFQLLLQKIGSEYDTRLILMLTARFHNINFHLSL